MEVSEEKSVSEETMDHRSTSSQSVQEMKDMIVFAKAEIVRLERERGQTAALHEEEIQELERKIYNLLRNRMVSNGMDDARTRMEHELRRTEMDMERIQQSMISILEQDGVNEIPNGNPNQIPLEITDRNRDQNGLQNESNSQNKQTQNTQNLNTRKQQANVPLEWQDIMYFANDHMKRFKAFLENIEDDHHPVFGNKMAFIKELETVIGAYEREKRILDIQRLQKRKKKSKKSKKAKDSQHERSKYAATGETYRKYPCMIPMIIMGFVSLTGSSFMYGMYQDAETQLEDALGVVARQAVEISDLQIVVEQQKTRFQESNGPVEEIDLVDDLDVDDSVDDSDWNGIFGIPSKDSSSSGYSDFEEQEDPSQMSIIMLILITLVTAAVTFACFNVLGFVDA